MYVSVNRNFLYEILHSFPGFPPPLIIQSHQIIELTNLRRCCVWVKHINPTTGIFNRPKHPVCRFPIRINSELHNGCNIR